MKTNRDPITDPEPDGLQAPTPKAQALKLGIDVHAYRYVAVRQLDGNTLQLAKTFPSTIYWAGCPTAPVGRAGL